jgi:hypothetical protein
MRFADVAKGKIIAHARPSFPHEGARDHKEWLDIVRPTAEIIDV